MLTSKNFKQEQMANSITVKILNNVSANGKSVKIGDVIELEPIVANSLINYGDAELCDEKPKAKKTPKKKVAKSKPLVDATR